MSPGLSNSPVLREARTQTLWDCWMWLREWEACSPTHSLGTGPCEFQESLSYQLTLLTTPIKITSRLSRQNIPCSVAKLCLTLCDPMDCSTPGFPVLHYLPSSSNSCPLFGDAIQPSHPLSSFSFCLQSFPASRSFPMNGFFP